MLSLVGIPVGAAEQGTYLSATGTAGTEDRVVVNVIPGTTLSDITSIAWSEYLLEGYPPHVDIKLDINNNGTYDGTGGGDDALVFEYAYNSPTHYAAGTPTYGALTGAWYQTFSDDGEGPVAVTGTANGWLTSADAGPWTEPHPNFYHGTLAEWKSGSIAGLPGGKVINGATKVFSIEIEIDNWVVNTKALLKNVVVETVNSGTIGVTVTIPPDLIQISITPSTVDFGIVYPGHSSIITPATTLTITNTGSVVTKVSATTASEFYDSCLSMKGTTIALWKITSIAEAASETVPLQVNVPSSGVSGTKTGTIVFWAEKVIP